MGWGWGWEGRVGVVLCGVRLGVAGSVGCGVVRAEAGWGGSHPTALPNPPHLTPPQPTPPCTSRHRTTPARLIPPSPTPETAATPEPTVVLILPEPAATLASAVTSTPESPPGVESLPVNHTPRPAPFPTWTPLPPALPREDSGPGMLLVVLVALQGLALVLGICLALYRGRV